VSSRYAFDSHGRLVVEVTSPTIVELPVGWRAVVVGNDLPCNQVGFGWLGRTGRPPTAREMVEARAPYNSTARQERERRQPVDDELLAEAAAIELARLEQQRQPADLVNVAA
jgi:hypothetical protein